MVDNTIALQVANPDILGSYNRGQATAIAATNAKREQAMQVMQHIGAVSLGAMGGSLDGEVNPQAYEQGLDVLERMGLPVQSFRGRPEMARVAARASLTAMQQLQLARSDRDYDMALKRFEADMSQFEQGMAIRREELDASRQERAASAERAEAAANREAMESDRAYNLQRERFEYQKGQEGDAQSPLGKLKRDLDAGLIDRPTYDAAVKKATSESGGITVSPDGTVTIGGQLGKLTESQSKDVNFIKRGSASLKLLRKFGDALSSLQDTTAAKLPLGNYAVSKEYQQALQAGREFIAVLLRKDTGAAVTKEEMALYGPMVLPQPGDSPEVLAQKREARVRIIEAIRLGLGSKGDAFPTVTDEGEPDEDGPRRLAPVTGQGVRVGDPEFENMSDEELDELERQYRNGQ